MCAVVHGGYVWGVLRLWDEPAMCHMHQQVSVFLTLVAKILASVSNVSCESYVCGEGLCPIFVHALEGPA